MLAARSRFAQPRQRHEAVATELDERNRAAMIAWRIRWSQRVAYPDAYADRPLRSDAQSWRRYLAREWLATRAALIERRLRTVK
jgi:hypothetical protein